MVGRLLGSLILKAVAPARLMTVCATGATICMLLTITSNGQAGITALYLTYLFESVMLRSARLSMALTDVAGSNTKTASSYLICLS